MVDGKFNLSDNRYHKVQYTDPIFKLETSMYGCPMIIPTILLRIKGRAPGIASHDVSQ